MIERQIIKPVGLHLKEPEITLLTGSRQVGKTTILKSLKSKCEAEGKPCFHFNLEFPKYLHSFNEDPENLFKHIPPFSKEKYYVFIDEIQYLKNPSNFLKLLYDEFRDKVKLVVTGSSAFYIDEKFTDSLAGRKKIFNVKPLNFYEYVNYKSEKGISAYLQNGLLSKKKIPLTYSEKLQKLFEDYIIFGGYPRSVLSENTSQKIEVLEELTTSYIQKDMAEGGIRKSFDFRRMLELLASRCGNRLNINEISNTLKISIPTANHFLYILQKSFHITTVKPFHRNYTKELTKMPKLYFQDTGFRNSLINNFAPIHSRSDKGMLLENAAFILLRQHYNDPSIQYWNTVDQHEVDFILQKKDALEIKFDGEKVRQKEYKVFKTQYPEIKLRFASMSKPEKGLAVWEI